MAIPVQLVKRQLAKKKRNGQHQHRWAVRWFDPLTGERRSESTGTADRVQAELYRTQKWAELNLGGPANDAEAEPVEAIEPKLAPTWVECKEALEKAMNADNCRPNYVADCLMTLECLRRMFPEAGSPADITPEMAKKWKQNRAEEKPAPSPWTVKSDLSTLRAIFGKWLKDECGLLTENPFASVRPPKVDDPEIRIVSASETDALFAWLADRWNNWALPAIYLEIAAHSGWRASEIASMREDDILADGYIRVRGGSSKTRKEKHGWLPKELHAELKECAAGGYAFGKFADELRRRLLLVNQAPNHAARVRDFAPHRMVAWLQDELQRFHAWRQEAENEAAGKEGREAEKLSAFTLHDFRRTAITGMQIAGVSEKEASIQVGCSPEVMRRHYERLDGMAIAKRNAERRLNVTGPEAVRLHSARRVYDPQGGSAALDQSANRTQTVSA